MRWISLVSLFVNFFPPLMVDYSNFLNLLVIIHSMKDMWFDLYLHTLVYFGSAAILRFLYNRDQQCGAINTVRFEKHKSFRLL